MCTFLCVLKKKGVVIDKLESEGKLDLFFRKFLVLLGKQDDSHVMW